MATVLDAITAALQDLGVVSGAEDPSAEDSALALARLNDWIDGLRHEHLLLPFVARTTWTLTSASSYTIGTSLTINVARPQGRTAIQGIGYIDTALTPDGERLVPLLTDAEYAGLTSKALTATEPKAFYYQPTYASGGTIIPWPIPTRTDLTGVIYTLSPLAEFAALTDTLVPAQGYRRFFRTNLAVELAPAFEREPSQTLMRAAMESKALVKLSTVRPMQMRSDDGILMGHGRAAFDIEQG